MTDRGIVISGQLNSLNEEKTEYEQVVSKGDINRYLMYWDKISCPVSTNVSELNLLHLDFLIECGVLEKGYFNSFGHPTPKSQVDSVRYQDFLFKNSKEPGMWTLASSGNDIAIPETSSPITCQTIEVRLFNCLPIPGEDIPYEDILNFKHHRSDQLNNLRFSLDEIYQNIIGAKDIPRQLDTSIGRLQKTLLDLDAVTKESFPARVLGAMKIQLNPISLGLHSINGAVAFSNIGVPTNVSYVLAAGLGAINFSLSQTKVSASLPPALQDYMYIKSALDRMLIK